jgi:L-aspartate oxidase
MEADAGVLREASGLVRLGHSLAAWTSGEPEVANLLVAARLLVASAALREESVGAHFRLDFPERRVSGGGEAEAGTVVVRQPALAGRSL